MKCPKCGGNNAHIMASLAVSFDIVDGKPVPVYVDDLVDQLYDAYDYDASDVSLECCDCGWILPVELNEEDVFEILDVDDDGNVIGRIKL